MKKIIVLLFAAALLCTTGCKKDDPAPVANSSNSGNGNGGTTPPAEINREGMYKPNGKIVNIVSSGNGTAEVWNWENGQLQSVSESGGDLLADFSYKTDGRVSSVTRYGSQFSGTMGVTYNGEYISRISLMNGDSEVAGASVSHNANNKVGSASLNLSDNYLLDIFNSTLSQYLSDTANLAPQVDSVQGNLAFDWNGENVSAARMGLSFRVKIMWGTLRGMLTNLSALGVDTSAFNLLSDDTPIIFKITARDTAYYTAYDNKVNPFRHYLGNLENLLQLDASVLSANNVKAGTISGTVTVEIKAEISASILGQTFTQVIPLYSTSQPLPSSVIDNTYIYNSANYPTSVTDSEGNVTTYTYAQ